MPAFLILIALLAGCDTSYEIVTDHRPENLLRVETPMRYYSEDPNLPSPPPLPFARPELQNFKVSLTPETDGYRLVVESESTGTDPDQWILLPNVYNEKKKTYSMGDLLMTLSTDLATANSAHPFRENYTHLTGGRLYRFTLTAEFAGRVALDYKVIYVDLRSLAR